MNYVLLSGNSIHNKEWICELRDLVLDKSDNVYIHNYKHWNTNEDLIDFEYEIKNLVANINHLSQYIILAKSVGDVLALNLLKTSANKPTACLFLGLPITLTNELGISMNELINDVNIPIIIAQNDKDPFGSFKDVNELIKLANNSNIKTYKFRGNTHSYINFNEIKQLVLKLT